MLFLLQIVPYSDTNEAIWEHFYIAAIFMYKLKYREMMETRFHQGGKSERGSLKKKKKKKTQLF